MILRHTIVVPVCLLSAACVIVGGPQPGREEFVQAQRHVFKRIPQSEIIAAARQVLVLADGDDFDFTESANGFSARQDTTISPVQAYWRVTVESRTGAEQVGYVTVTGPDMNGLEAPTGSLALYRMFWARVDYLLGLNQHWAACGGPEPYPGKSYFYNGDDGLCGTAPIKDNPPPPFQARDQRAR